MFIAGLSARAELVVRKIVPAKLLVLRNGLGFSDHCCVILRRIVSILLTINASRFCECVWVMIG